MFFKVKRIFIGEAARQEFWPKEKEMLEKIEKGAEQNVYAA